MKLYFDNDNNQGWIFREIHNDYCMHTKHKLVGYNDAEAAWFLNPWRFNKLSSDKPHFVSIHHVDESKLREWRFDYISKYADGCFVPNKFTKETVEKHTTGVPVYIFPYWLRSGIHKISTGDTFTLKKKLSPNNEILIGSFQKDSEGDSKRPKLSKGPDRFLNIITKLSKTHNIKVILTGYSRKYLIHGLINNGIPYEYFEMTNDLNRLYSCLDWYFVTSRVEGGPQAVLEASFHRVKILSYPVGMAPDVLHSNCLCDSDEEFCEKFEVSINENVYNYNSVNDGFLCVDGVHRIDEFFDGIIA